MSNEKEIELKAAEINGSLIEVPSWFVRWGITLTFSIIVLVLSPCFFIKYADNLPAVITVTAVNSSLISGEHAMTAKLLLPIRSSGKLKIGQTLNIKLHNYPLQEYGMLKGVVQKVLVMPNGGICAVGISLPNGLVTAKNKKLEYKQNMQMGGEIITDELSLFERVFSQFR